MFSELARSMHRSGKEKDKKFLGGLCLRFFLLRGWSELKEKATTLLGPWDAKVQTCGHRMLPNAWTMTFRWIRWKEIGGTRGFGVFMIAHDFSSFGLGTSDFFQNVLNNVSSSIRTNSEKA